MNLAVKLYQHVPSDKKLDGIPDMWPAEVIELRESTTLPGENYILMTIQELDTHKNTYLEAFESWNNDRLAASIAKEKAIVKYMTRARVKDRLIAEIAVENVERIKNGTWQISDLIALTQDAGIKAVLDDMNSLSFELALAKIDNIAAPIITTEIKNQWKAKLASSLFN